MKTTIRLNRPLTNYLVLTIVIFALILLLPANKIVMAEYGMSARQYHILLFMVELPLAAIWLAAFYGYSKLRQYAYTVRKTPEGKGYAQLADGFKWLAWGLILPVLVSLIVNSIANSHPGFHSTAIIVVNYLNVIFPLIAFSIISNAGRSLNRGKSEAGSLTGNKSLLLLFVTLGVGYCFLIFRHIDVQNSVTNRDNPYYLPVWLIVATIVIPYLYAWFIGLLAAYDLRLLAKRVKGVLYRQALHLVAGGVSVVIASLIAIQYLRSVVPRTGHLSLNLLLLTVYLIYILNIIGFVMIILGVSRLKRIEDI